jgi:hypothetical protein
MATNRFIDTLHTIKDSLRSFAFIHDHPRSFMIIQIMATYRFIFANHINSLRGVSDSLHSSMVSRGYS